MNIDREKLTELKESFWKEPESINEDDIFKGSNAGDMDTQRTVVNGDMTGKIKKVLAKVPYFVRGDQYVLVPTEDFQEIMDEIPTENVANNDPDFVIVSFVPFTGDQDVTDALEYCGLYSGQ